MRVLEHVPVRVGEPVARPVGQEQRALVEDAHEPGRVAARGDVAACRRRAEVARQRNGERSTNWRVRSFSRSATFDLTRSDGSPSIERRASSATTGVAISPRLPDRMCALDDREGEHLRVREALLQLPRAHSASSAQTITVGPEPESVAPAAPAGRSARIASSSGRGPVGLVQPVVERRREQSSASPRGDPGAEQRGARDVERGVRVRRPRREARAAPRPSAPAPPGSTATGVERQRVGDPGDPPVPRQAGAAGEAGGEVVGVALERRRRGRAAPRRRAPAPSSSPPRPCPSAIVAALEPSPRARGIRSVHSNDSPSGRGEERRTRGCRCAPGRAGCVAPSVTSTSFQRSSATPAQSKPGPRFAVVAGARTRGFSAHSRSTASGSLARGR